jgi:hypothetical protein
MMLCSLGVVVALRLQPIRRADGLEAHSGLGEFVAHVLGSLAAESETANLDSIFTELERGKARPSSSRLRRMIHRFSA